MITFAGDKRFGLFGIGHGETEENKNSRQKAGIPEHRQIPFPWDFFPWPLCGYSASVPYFCA